MSRRSKQAVERAQFRVHELTKSKVASRDQLEQADQARADRLRAIGWNDRADEIEARWN